jgi:ParB family transcriptional regulator, chromosome partitioning protein
MTTGSHRDKGKRLGRGLSSLIDSPVEVSSAENARAVSPSISAQSGSSESGELADGYPQVQMIPLASISANPFQPRKQFDPATLAELAASIKASGLMQPIILRKSYNSESKYELVAGERRWRAAQLAGLEAVPALVQNLSDEQSAEWALVENLQREDLNAIDRADALKGLVDRFGLTHAQIAEKIGLDRSTVANLIRLADLEPQIRELISGHALSAGHGKALLQLSPGMSRVRLAQRAADEHWSVRKLEMACKPEATHASAPRATASSLLSAEEAQLRDLERQLGEFLGTKVALKVTGASHRGQIALEFYGLEHFDGLLSRIGFKSR